VFILQLNVDEELSRLPRIYRYFSRLSATMNIPKCVRSYLYLRQGCEQAECEWSKRREEHGRSIAYITAQPDEHGKPKFCTNADMQEITPNNAKSTKSYPNGMRHAREPLSENKTGTPLPLKSNDRVYPPNKRERSKTPFTLTGIMQLMSIYM